MIEMYVARHAETELNVKRSFQGHVDPPLNISGTAQAKRLSEIVNGLAIDVTYSSDLARARETAEIAIRAHHFIIDSRLREQNFGLLDGLDGATALRECPEAFKTWQSGDASTRLLGGESVLDVAARVNAFLSELRWTEKSKRVLIITHGGVLECMRAIALGFAHRSFKGTNHPHAMASLFIVTENGLELAFWGADLQMGL